MYHVLIDMDGVLADFVGASMKVHPGHPYPFTGEVLGNETGWDYWKLWGITAEEFWAPMANRQYWADIPKLPWADRIVTACEQAVGPEHVGVLTSAGERLSGAYDGKLDWLRTHFPHLTGRVLVSSGAKEFCARPTTLLIDDSEKNCRAFVRQGGKAYVWPGDWNSRYHRLNDGHRASPASLHKAELDRLTRALEQFVGYY